MENNKPVILNNQLPEKEKKNLLSIAKNAVAKGAQKLSAKALAPYKNFFFTELAASKEFQDCESVIGKIHSVTIIISKERTYMVSKSLNDMEETDFTEEEKKRMLQTFKVKQSTVDSCRSIFLRLDIIGQTIHIRQNKLDGTKKTINF